VTHNAVSNVLKVYTLTGKEEHVINVQKVVKDVIIWKDVTNVMRLNTIKKVKVVFLKWTVIFLAEPVKVMTNLHVFHAKTNNLYMGKLA
jgi:hypothetical protein